MATIDSSIQLTDNFTNVLNHVLDSVNLTISAMEDLSSTMDSPLDTASLEAARDSINQATMAAHQLSEAIQNVGRNSSPDLPTPTWNSDTGIEIFNTSGFERYQQEIESVNQMMTALRLNQEALTQNATYSNILPPQAANDMANLNTRIQGIAQRVQQISARPIDTVTPQELNELESLREQLNRALNLQRDIDNAVDNMDVEAANRAYLELTRTVGNTERMLRDNTSEQQNFNEEVRNGQSEMEKLGGFIQKAVGAFIGLQTIKGAINLSDEMSSLTGRLSMIDIGNNTVAEESVQALSDNTVDIPVNVETDSIDQSQKMLEMTYQAAQNAGGSLQGMADVIARFGNNAGDAFDSTEQVVQFSELVQKQMTIAGASTEEASNAMLQLSQALGSGVLRGDELNSIFEQAPNLIQGIADYLDVPIGQIREMASEGQLSADVVKNSILQSADEINKNFKAIPKTWDMVAESAKNTAVMAIQPILGEISNAASAVYDQVGEIGNSGVIQQLAGQFTPIIPAVLQIVQTVVGMIPKVASVISPIITIVQNIVNFIVANIPTINNIISLVVGALINVMKVLQPILNLVMTVAQAFIDNWSIIAPVIGTIVTALAAYQAVQLAVNAAELIGKGIKIASCVAAYAHAAATGAEVSATTAETAAQYGLNSALLACPITWIIVLIVAVIALIFAVCSAIAKMTGVANTGFGVICGGIIVAIMFFKNLGLFIANFAIAVWNSIKNIGKWFVNLGQSALAVIQNIGAWLQNVFFGLVAVVQTVGDNIGAVFNNAWVFVQTGFWKLVDGLMQGLKGLAEFANNVLIWTGLNVDTSGFDFAKDKISELNDQYREFKDVGAAWDEGLHTVEYKDVSQPWEDNPIDWKGEWEKGINTFDVFQDGWAEDAFNSGAAWGDGAMDKIDSLLKGGLDSLLPSTDNYGGLADYETTSNISDIAKAQIQSRIR